MNVQEIIDYLYEHVWFIEQFGQDLYLKANLSKVQLFNLITYPMPFHLPKKRRNQLFTLVELIRKRKEEVCNQDVALKEQLYREKLVELERKKVRYIPVDLKKFKRKRKRWIMS